MMQPAGSFWKRRESINRSALWFQNAKLIPFDQRYLPLSSIYSPFGPRKAVRNRTQVGFPFETTLAAARLAYTGTLERFPNMKIVLCHLGGVIPYLIGRLDLSFNKHPACRTKISRPPSYYFKRMYYDMAICYTNEQLMCAIGAVGEDQILLGTDLPLTNGRIGPCLDLLASASLSDRVREKIYEGNTKRLMGVSPQPADR